MTSRIGKLLRESTGVVLFKEGEDLRERDVLLVFDERSDAMLVRSAVALTLRCFLGRTVVATPTSSASQPLAAEAEAEAASYGASDRLSFDIDAAADPLVLGLGCTCDGVFVDAHGWEISVNQLCGRGLPATAPAAAFAAAAGVAKLFANIIRRRADVVGEAWSSTLLDLDDADAATPIDIGRVTVIGAGAIGSGLAHVLRHSDWNGEVLYVDSQRYDEPNHETTLLISMDDALRQAPKAETLARLCNTDRLSCRGVQEMLVENHSLLAKPTGAILCAVDNSVARRLLDRTAAPVVFNAGVGGSRHDAGHVLWTRHDPETRPLSSLYRVVSDPAKPDSEAPPDIATDACSRIAYESVSLAAPFMGLAAGALLAAGLAQQALGIRGRTDYMKLDLLGLQERSTRKSLRLRRDGSR